MYNHKGLWPCQEVRGARVNTYESLNGLLLELFRDLADLEQRAAALQEYPDITNNDMRVIRAIGVDEPRNMSSIARELSVTVGTLTISMNSLVKKGYVHRERGIKDRRVVYTSLSEKGKAAYRHYEEFRSRMIESVLEVLTEEEAKVLVKSLEKLSDWSHSFQENE
ncbi:MAG: MarR family transcriptional regulator [Clostridiales bacterium]|nr:MarR family transcriptional regulator [Clostridiales bacterium]